MSNNRPGKDKSLEQKQEARRHLIEDFTKAIKSNPKDAAAYFNRGMIYHEQGKYDEAIADYKKAMKLEPKLKTQIESHIERKLKRGDDLKKIPDAPLVKTQTTFLGASDLSHLSQTNKKYTKLFKPELLLKKLLGLVVRYDLDEKTIEAGIKAGVNPILKEVNLLLTQDPTLALKRDHITDHSGRKFYWSPLEAAHWSRNWVLRDMIFKHALSIPMKDGLISGEERATEQLREWDAKAYNYDLILMRASGDTFPILKKIPTLIKQQSEEGEDRIFQWGDVNGEWMLTELDSATQAFFTHLNFPDTSGKKPITTTRDQITKDMYDALQKGHTPARFDLNEYIRDADAFIKKYPGNIGVTQAQWDKRDTDSYKLGLAQKKMPAWLAAIWCSTIPFHPLPEFKHLIARPDVCRLKLYYGEDFFDTRLGKYFSIYKGSLSAPVSRVSPAYPTPAEVLTVPPRFFASHTRGAVALIADLAAMAALCKVITDEFRKSKQLLPEESKSTPGLSG